MDNETKFKKAIENFNNNPGATENFIFYMSNHFDKWRNKYASTLDEFINELYMFSNIE